VLIKIVFELGGISVYYKIEKRMVGTETGTGRRFSGITSLEEEEWRRRGGRKGEDSRVVYFYR
jgi:hypothetical protein